MVIHQTLPIRTPIVDRVSIVMRQLSSTLHGVTQLPKQIRRHTTIL